MSIIGQMIHATIDLHFHWLQLRSAAYSFGDRWYNCHPMRKTSIPVQDRWVYVESVCFERRSNISMLLFNLHICVFPRVSDIRRGLNHLLVGLRILKKKCVNTAFAVKGFSYSNPKAFEKWKINYQEVNLDIINVIKNLCKSTKRRELISHVDVQLLGRRQTTIIISPTSQWSSCSSTTETAAHLN